MSSEPPPEKRPTGPPSGPLSGQGSGSGASEPPEPTRADWPSEPTVPGTPSGPSEPPGPPAPPTGGHAAPGPGPGGGSPWWRSAPKVAILAGVLVAAGALAVFLLRSDGGSGEVFLQPASAEGKDPFTKSTAKDTGSQATAAPTHAPADSGGTRSVQGSAPGLYGGTPNVPGCDVERQIRYLTEDQAKGRAFAKAADIEQGAIAPYLRGLTPVQLRADTRVTNHGYTNGSANAYQAVLQTGTSVLVDGKGLPRVRCACGNPLGPPVAVKGTPKPQGQQWRAYRPDDVVAIEPATTVLVVIIIYDPGTGQWFERPVGTHGENDRPIPPPEGGLSSAPESPDESPGSESPSAPSSPPSSEPPPSPPQSEQPPGPAYGPRAVTTTAPPGAPSSAPPGPRTPSARVPRT
ncbi:DUF6777 domain-containing protein [Streptomyces sp. ISL-11]|uniref:DUF6777 domain-containing protein n=1 Tax=Streptomyces sp. ISL-11 TaxID=2819174 RepID=UPI001BE594E2|nr:DUF6777 domain-containing protein [Streptomyces sp. ISL-11]MBT2387205.1 hypothetical protein [Streptomyces sp. ISL-11]